MLLANVIMVFGNVIPELLTHYGDTISESIAATGHTEVTDNAVSATCTTTGNIEYNLFNCPQDKKVLDLETLNYIR